MDQRCTMQTTADNDPIVNIQATGYFIGRHPINQTTDDRDQGIGSSRSQEFEPRDFLRAAAESCPQLQFMSQECFPPLIQTIIQTELESGDTHQIGCPVFQSIGETIGMYQVC